MSQWCGVGAILQQNGFNVLSSGSGSEALSVSRSCSDKIDLLVTDLQMGVGMNGIQLAEQISQDRCGIAVRVISGISDSKRLALERHLSFLAKPFTASSFMQPCSEFRKC